MSFQEFQFSKAALLSVRWKAHVALCHTEHATEAGRWPPPVCAAPAPGGPPGQLWGAAFHPRPVEVRTVPGRQRWSQGAVTFVSVADSSL